MAGQLVCQLIKYADCHHIGFREKDKVGKIFLTPVGKGCSICYLYLLNGAYPLIP